MIGRDFLAAARRQAAGAGEADWRSAASRAYYAAFHVARDLFDTLGFTTPHADRAHNYLYVRFNNCGLSHAIAGAKSLHDLRQTRNGADYDVRRPFPLKIAADAVLDADRIMQILDALTPAERVRIIDAMKVYEQGIGDVTWRP
jgi:uncharacterized protein (UPF0332 family)